MYTAKPPLKRPNHDYAFHYMLEGIAAKTGRTVYEVRDDVMQQYDAQVKTVPRFQGEPAADYCKRILGGILMEELGVLVMEERQRTVFGRN